MATLAAQRGSLTMPRFLVTASYATKHGNLAARNLVIEADSIEAAMQQAIKRVEAYKRYGGKFHASASPMHSDRAQAFVAAKQATKTAAAIKRLWSTLSHSEQEGLLQEIVDDDLKAQLAEGWFDTDAEG
jgi:hypothetical protein